MRKHKEEYLLSGSVALRLSGCEAASFMRRSLASLLHIQVVHL